MGKCRDCKYMGVVLDKDLNVCTYEYHASMERSVRLTAPDSTCKHFLAKPEPTVSFTATTPISHMTIEVPDNWLTQVSSQLPKLDKAVEY